MTDEPQEEWEVYPGELEGEFALFAADLALAERAPDEGRGWLNIVRIHFDAQPNGMPDPTTHERLQSSEDSLGAFLDERGAIPAGRLTTAGRRELFIYSATDDAEPLRRELERDFPDLEVETLATQDVGWRVYLEMLYPTPLDFQRIQNAQVVRTLTAHGDDPYLPRDVDHFAYFPDEDSRATFRDDIEEWGFDIGDEQEVEDEDEGYRYVVTFSHHGSVDIQSIDQVTGALWLRADELGGYYDGWGCPVAKSDEEE